MATPLVELSVVLVAGSQRERAQRVIDAIAAQTALPSIELILVDLAPLEAKRLEITEQVAHVRLSRPDIRRWGIARADGARAASGLSVAFIEDHCFPTPTWAEMLIAAHRNPWGGVGYAFTNAAPDTYVTRTSLMARYGAFVHPAKGGRANLISGNNVSYKRDLLLSFGSQLEEVLTIDFNLQEILNARDIPMFVESGALAAHQHFTTVKREGIAGHYYCRLLAAKRAETQHWSAARRLLYGIGAPVGSPVIRLWRLIAGLRGRGELQSTVILGLPVIVACYFFDSLGESLGYLFGVGTSESEALHWELDAARESES